MQPITVNFGALDIVKNLTSKVKKAVAKKSTRTNYFPDIDSTDSLLKNIRKKTSAPSTDSILNKTSSTKVYPIRRTNNNSDMSDSLINRTKTTNTYKK